MMNKIKQIFKPYIIHYIGRKISLNWTKWDEESWLTKTFTKNFTKPPISPYCLKIEKLAQQTNQKGAQPLWEGYASNNNHVTKRMPDVVRTQAQMGNLFTYLVGVKKPEIIVEFGTAFGVSGMYYLAGLEANKKGKLLTFEPNNVWAELAKENLSQISDRFKLTIGTFEAHIDNVLPKDQYIDIAFIDAVHTKEFVIPQLETVISRGKKGTIIILDDINFSDDMKQCWEEISENSIFICSVAFGNRVGILELKEIDSKNHFKHLNTKRKK